MPRVLSNRSFLQCAHGGSVRIKASQDLVTIEGIAALVKPDLLGRPIAACPNATPSTPPCTRTVAVDEGPSYSAFASIGGHALAKSTATGRTNWSLLNIVPFGVTNPQQDLLTVTE